MELEGTVQNGVIVVDSPEPLPELFAALREQVPALVLREFHDGLRRLRDLRAVDLLPVAPGQDALAEPEFALLDGARWLYYVAR